MFNHPRFLTLSSKSSARVFHPLKVKSFQGYERGKGGRKKLLARYLFTLDFSNGGEAGDFGKTAKRKLSDLTLYRSRAPLLRLARETSLSAVMSFQDSCKLRMQVWSFTVPNVTGKCS